MATGTWYQVPGTAAAHYGHKREVDTSFPDGSDAQKQSVAVFERRKGHRMSWIMLANMTGEIHDRTCSGRGQKACLFLVPGSHPLTSGDHWYLVPSICLKHIQVSVDVLM